MTRAESEQCLDLGDLMIILLGGSLAGIRDHLAADGFDIAAEVVADLVEITDDYLTRCVRGRQPEQPTDKRRRCR